MEPGARFDLSGFADEISPQLDVQVQTLQRLGVPGLDLRSVDGVNVLDLTLADFERINEACHAHGLHVQSIGSPVNKIPFSLLSEGTESDRLRRACKAASHVNCRRIRIFAPEVPEGVNETDRIIAWMAGQRRIAEDNGVVLIVENDAKYWCAFPDHAKVMFERLGGPNFRAAFDFANTVLLGFRPWDDWFPWILPHLDTLHIKDAIQSEGRVVPAGEGDGQIAQTLQWLVEQGWSGPLTLEPHLAAAGPMGGFSGEQLFERAVQALRSILPQ